MSRCGPVDSVWVIRGAWTETRSRLSSVPSSLFLAGISFFRDFDYELLSLFLGMYSYLWELAKIVSAPFLDHPVVPRQSNHLSSSNSRH